MFNYLRLLRLKSSGTLACYMLAVGLTIYYWGPLIHAKWGLIDDHEIMRFVGTQERLPLSNIIPTLQSTEIGSNSPMQRFRPAFYTLRVTEAAVWGKDSSLWYSFRILIALLLAATLTHVCVRLAGPLITFGFLVFELSRPYWADIFARAGVAETYAVLGLCLIALGWGTKFRKELQALPVFAISIGILIAGGSKENFLIIGFLPLWLLFTNRIKISSSGKLMLIGAICYLTWISLTVYHGLRHAGMDIYANDISPLSRIRVAFSFFAISAAKYWLAGLLLLILLGSLLRIIAKNSSEASIGRLANSLDHYLLAESILLTIYGSQFIFYAGKWPGNVAARYLFPGILAFHLGAFIGFIVLSRFVKASGISKSKILLLEVAIAVAFLAGSANTVKLNRISSLETVKVTGIFNRKFETMASYLKNNPSLPVIINSYSAWDYEPIVSISRFMKARGLTNPIAIQIQDYSYEQFPEGSLERILAKRLEDKSSDLATVGVIPIEKVSHFNCFSIGMSGPFLDTCTDGINIWPFK